VFTEVPSAACQPPSTQGKVPLLWHRCPLSALTPPQALRPCRRSSSKKSPTRSTWTCELLPETWRLDSEAQGSCCQNKRPRRGMITDFQVWSECYATMGGILSARYPNKASHLFTYLRTISQASCTFESSAWASYDMAFHRQAANHGSLNWGWLMQHCTMRLSQAERGPLPDVLTACLTHAAHEYRMHHKK